jgi:uncharacterized protein DUF1697
MIYAAFLRAINVGAHNRIRMAELRALAEGLGYGDVRTYLQTGNLVLEAGRRKPATVAGALEDALTSHGLRNVDVMVRTDKELEDVVRSDPFASWDPDAFGRFVLFTRTAVEPPRKPQELKGVTFLPSSPHALLAVSERGSRTANPQAVAEAHWKVRCTGRWWHVVCDFTRDVVSG